MPLSLHFHAPFIPLSHHFHTTFTLLSHFFMPISRPFHTTYRPFHATLFMPLSRPVAQLILDAFDAVKRESSSGTQLAYDDRAAMARRAVLPLETGDAMYFLITLACSANIGSALTYTGSKCMGEGVAQGEGCGWVRKRPRGKGV